MGIKLLIFKAIHLNSLVNYFKRYFESISPEYYIRSYKSSFIRSVSMLLIGFVISILIYLFENGSSSLLESLEILYSYERDIISYPLLSLFPYQDFPNIILYDLVTNILYENILFITIPGLLMLSNLSLYIKYFLRGVIIFPLIIYNAVLGVSTLFILVIELAGFSASATASQYIGTALFKPDSFPGESYRLEKFKASIKNLIRIYIYLVIPIFLFSSLIESIMYMLILTF